MRRSVTSYRANIGHNAELDAFRRARTVNMAVIFAVCAIALVLVIGTAVDLSHRVMGKMELQHRLDKALRAGALENRGSRIETAEEVFDTASTSIARSSTRRFHADGDSLSGTASAVVPTTLSAMIGLRTFSVSAAGRVGNL